MTKLEKGILALLIERVKQLDAQIASDAVDYHALHRVVKSLHPGFAALYAKERKAVERLRAKRVLDDPAVSYDDLIQKLNSI